MDKQLLGFWRVCSIDMVEDKVVQLIGGLPGEVVEFTAEESYVLWGDPRRPSNSCCRTFRKDGIAALDVWIEGLESLVTRCIYQVDGSRLLICVAGNSGVRPTAFQRDDDRLWCLVSFERCEPPPKRRPTKPRKLLEPGSLLPKGLFGQRRMKRGK